MGNRTGVTRRSFIGLAGSTAAITAAAAHLNGAHAAEVTTGSTALPGSQDFKIHTPKGTPIAFEAEPVTNITEEFDVDVAVCGCGIAGISTAASCAENGLNTIVLEKGSSYAARGGDVAALGDRVHKAYGIELDENAFVMDWMTSSSYHASEKLVRTFAKRSGEALDWMMDRVGEKNLGEYVITFEDGNMDCSGVTWWASQVCFKGWYDVVGKLLEFAESQGAQVLYETPAVQLVTDDDGAVTGVVAKRADGSYVRYNAAKGVVLATGSYDYNPDMLKERIRPRDLVSRLWMNMTSTDTGDGHLMGIAVGALEDEYPQPLMLDPSGLSYDNYGPSAGMKPFLRVNAAGERFFNEYVPTDYICNAINNEFGAHDFILFDGDTVAALEKMADTSDGTFNTTPELRYKEIQEQCESAETLEELAGLMGVPAENLIATVNRYNAQCEAGVDEDFHKPEKYLTPIATPPFYFQDEGNMVLVTVGGLRIDDQNRVLAKANGLPISGLYAVGNVSGSMFDNYYPHHINGVSHGRCLTFGYLTGRRMAGME